MALYELHFYAASGKDKEKCVIVCISSVTHILNITNYRKIVVGLKDMVRRYKKLYHVT